MNVLWFCNSVLPCVSSVLDVRIIKPESWITALYSSICQLKDVHIIYLYPSKSMKEEYIDDYHNYFISYLKNGRDNDGVFRKILKRYQPDIIHIFGTENIDALCFVNTVLSCGLGDKTVVSIQGILTAIAEHYTVGLPIKVIERYTLRDFIKRDNIKTNQIRFYNRSKNEKKILQSVQHVIGRTEFDYALTKQINPNVTYHHCGESLRRSFYNNKWSLDKCQKHSIFVSQSNYPIKGFHFIIKAMSDIVRQYPDSLLYTTGKSPFAVGFKEKLYQTSYQKYLRDLIKSYELEDHIVFLGSLDEEQMCKRFLNSHIYISCSTIENSPNSLGEAMMLGVPCISSDVGGVKDFIEHNQNGFLYQCDAYYMIAYYVSKVFDDDKLACTLSEKSISIAKSLYNQDKNIDTLINTYKLIVNV